MSFQRLSFSNLHNISSVIPEGLGKDLIYIHTHFVSYVKVRFDKGDYPLTYSSSFSAYSYSKLSLGFFPLLVVACHGYAFCQGRGNSSNEIPRLWQGVPEGTGGAFSQQKSDTAFCSTLSGRRYSITIPARKKNTYLEVLRGQAETSSCLNAIKT